MPATHGEVIDGRYLLEEPIGEGGAATVWRATHIALEKPVAVKIHKSQVATEDVWDRYLREARVAAAVRHPNVVDIMDFGTLDDGHAYLVLEYLEGRTLARAFEEGLVSPIAMLQLTALALEGLAAVHAAGIVHRDIKPENVFLVRDHDGGVVPKILDFGVSRVALTTHRLQSTIPTLEGYIVGTPHYMSPEQARGIAAVDAVTDVYSMGVVLFEGLTGCLPYTADTPGDLLVRIISTEPESVRALRPDLDDGIHEIVERAMQKDPAARYPSARAMRDAVLTALEAQCDDRPMRRPVWISTPEALDGGALEDETLVADHTSAPLSVPSAPPRSLPRAGALWVSVAFAGAVGLGLASTIGFVFSTSRAEPAPTKVRAGAEVPVLAELPAGVDDADAPSLAPHGDRPQSIEVLVPEPVAAQVRGATEREHLTTPPRRRPPARPAPTRERSPEGVAVPAFFDSPGF